MAIEALMMRVIIQGVSGIRGPGHSEWTVAIGRRVLCSPVVQALEPGVRERAFITNHYQVNEEKTVGLERI